MFARVLCPDSVANARAIDEARRVAATSAGKVNIGRGFGFFLKTDGKLQNTVVGFGGPDADTIRRSRLTKGLCPPARIRICPKLLPGAEE
jgi:hypothetical protein